jgi:hypothetical protein
MGTNSGMTKPEQNDKPGGNKAGGDKAGGAAAPAPAAARHVYGPRPVGALVPALVRPAFRRRAPATAQVLADWEAIMGPALAAVTTPRKLFSGTLSIACSGPMALELQHLAEQLMHRINAHLGHVAVTRLRFVQDMRPARAPQPPPRLAAVAAARAAVSEVPEGALRDALESLGRAVLTRHSR